MMMPPKGVSFPYLAHFRSLQFPFLQMDPEKHGLLLGCSPHTLNPLTSVKVLRVAQHTIWDLVM